MSRTRMIAFMSIYNCDIKEIIKKMKGIKYKEQTKSEFL